nr:retrovirus-related Pol polyprotein from transposon TNT 1-94 [Tanacetum cinerariifolium]
MQTQTSNTLHNAIMEAGSKDRLPMLAPGNYIQLNSRIKRYIDTKPNQELIHYCLENPLYELGWKVKAVLDSKGNPTTATERVFETYKNVKQEIRDQLNAEAEAVQIILTGIDNDIYSIVDVCPNACETWKAIERLKQGESINVQDLETNLFWEFGKFMSLDGESLESYYSRFYKIMNELTRNQCKVTNHQVNVQFLLQLQPEWQRFVTLVKQNKEVLISEGSYVTTTETYMETYKNVSQDVRDQLNAEAKAVQIILTGIDNDIYSTVDACPNACEMWKAIERLKQGESINVQDLETNLYWEFEKFTSVDGESLESYYSRFYKMMNELIRNQCDSQELKTVSYHKLYDILKQHQNEVNEIKAERIARAPNPLALVTQQQPVYHPQNHPNHYTQNSSTRSQQAATRNRGKAIANSPQPIYDQEPSMFKKIYKPTNNNLRTSSNTSRANQDNSSRVNRGTGYDNQRLGNVVGARETVGTTVVQKSRIQCYNCKEFWHVAKECQKPKRVKDAAYHREKMLLSGTGSALYVPGKNPKVSPDAADSGPIFDAEPLQKVSNDDHYNVFAIESEHPEQSKSVHDIYPIEQDEHNVIIDSLDMSYDREQIDQNDDDNDLANERELLASLIEKLKCEIDDSKNRNKFLETSNKVLNEKLKETNKLLYNDFKKSQAELQRRNDMEYASKMEIDCAKAKGETISILSQQKEAQIKLYKTREEKELDKVIALENKVKVLDNIVYKTGQSVQTMNMLNNKCRTSFAKPEFLKKAQRANPRLYDIDSLKSQLETQKTQFLNEIDRLLRDYYYANHMNAILDRVMLNNSKGKKQEVEDQRRNVKLSKNKTSVPACNDSVNAKTLNVNFFCATCGKCVLNEKHDMCVLKSINGVISRTKMLIAVPVSTSEPKCTVKQFVAKPLKKTVALESNQKPRNITRKLYERISKACSWWYPKFTPSGYKWKPKSEKENVNPNLVEIVLCIVDSGCLKHMTGNVKLLINFVEKFLGTVKFGNEQIAPILGYGDLNDIVVGLSKLKFIKDHLCSSYELGKEKRKSFQSKITPSSKRRLQLLHMDICGPMRVVSINGKKYVLVIFDDYSRYTLTHFLRSKDEIPKVLIEFLRLVQRGLHAQVRFVRTDKGTEFLNKTLHAYFSSEGILHQKSVARTPKQNGVVERRNRTLVEAAQTMLSATKVPLFFWAEAIAIACFTQNRSLVIPRHEKTPYHIINDQKPLESSNNYFKEANNKLSETNNLLYTDYKKSEAELARRNSMEYASQMEIKCAKKEAQIKLYKTREDKELDKVIALENKVKVLDNIVYKTGQSVQMMNMLNNKCRMSFAKPEFPKKAQRANPHLCLNEEMVADLRYFNSLELEVVHHFLFLISLKTLRILYES